MPADTLTITLVSRKKLASMSAKEKVSFILQEVKQDKILVLEMGLDPAEEASLIERTMVEIDPDAFSGIEMESYREDVARDLFGRFLSKNAAKRATLTVVGPADRLKSIKKDASTIQALIVAGVGKARK